MQGALDALPEQYWATGTVRNNAVANDMNRNVPNPFHISNFESIRTSDPILYQHMSTLAQFTSTTIPKNRLLRPFPHMSGLNNSAEPLGKARTHALEVNFQRRLSRGFTFNASYSRMLQQGKTIFENETISRAEIARVTKLTRTTVSDVVAGLLSEGLVKEVGFGSSIGGKPSILLSLEADSRYLIGLNLAQNKFIGAVVNLRGQIKETTEIPVPDGDGE